MQIENPAFFKAKKDKQLTSVVLIQREEKRPEDEGGRKIYSYIRLCLEVKIPFTDKRDHVFVEAPTTFRIENYSGYSDSEARREIKTICFHCSVYHFGHPDHVQTFLDAIKPKSKVSFRVVAYNGSDYYRKNNLVNHCIYGEVDNKEYLLSYYVGSENTAAPVNGF